MTQEQNQSQLLDSKGNAVQVQSQVQAASLDTLDRTPVSPHKRKKEKKRSVNQRLTDLERTAHDLDLKVQAFRRDQSRLAQRILQDLEGISQGEAVIWTYLVGIIEFFKDRIEIEGTFEDVEEAIKDFGRKYRDAQHTKRVDEMISDAQPGTSFCKSCFLKTVSDAFSKGDSITCPRCGFEDIYVSPDLEDSGDHTLHTGLTEDP